MLRRERPSYSRFTTGVLRRMVTPMPDDNLYRSLEADEVEALGPMPSDDVVSPTTDRDNRSPSLTAEVHSPGVVPSSTDVADDDRFPPPRSLSEDD
jgi:hypothetical protein